MNLRVELNDANQEDIRQRLQDEVTRRWTHVAREVKRAILQNDALSIGEKAPRLAQPTADKAHMFRRWLDEKLIAGVAGYDGSWLEPHIDLAASRGARRVAMGDAGPDDEPRDDRGRWSSGGAAESGGRAYVSSERSDFHPDRDRPIAAEAKAYVLKHGRETNTEYLVAINGSGETVATLAGDKHSVGFTRALEEAGDNPDSGMVVHHNHPSSISLSGPDITQLSKPGIAAIWAHGNDGISYRAELTPRARVNVLAAHEAGLGAGIRLFTAHDAASTAITNAVSPMFAGKPLAERGVLKGIANANHSGWVAQTLHNAGIIDYTSGKAIMETATAHALGIEGVMAEGARIAKEIFYGKGGGGEDHPDRPAQPLRLAGDVGTSFVEVAQPARRRAAEDGADRAGGEAADGGRQFGDHTVGDAQQQLAFLVHRRPPSARICHAATVAGLASVCEDVSARAHDGVAQALTGRASPMRVSRLVDAAMGVGLSRTRMLAEHAVTQAYSQATLDALEAAGVTHVGTLSEHSAFYADSMQTAAGIMFLDPDDKALFLHRTDGKGWAWPGGGVEPPEGLEQGAVREAQEECGGAPLGPLTKIWRSTGYGVDFHTFSQEVTEQFTPTLNSEHDAFTWASVFDPPTPLHPGVAEMLRGEGVIDDDEVIVEGQNGGRFRVVKTAEGYAVYAADFDPDEPRDESGRWTQGGSITPSLVHTGGSEFVSPSVASHLSFDEARGALDGARQKTMLTVADEIDSQLGLKESERSVIGAWSDGAENSVLASLPDASWDEIRLSAAMKGYVGDQKAVLAFKQDDGGDALLYQMHAAGDLKTIHQRLLADGLAFHSLAPTSDGADVYVADLDGSAHEGIQRAAEDFHGAVTYQRGHAEFLGTTQETGTDREIRDDARRAYEGIIHQSPVQGGAEVWRRNRDRWSSALAQAVADAWFADYARTTPQPQHPRTGQFAKAHVVAREKRRSKRSGQFRKQGLDPDEQRKEELAEARFSRVRGRLDVVTAGDDRVCDVCDGISSGGPYTINTARGLIPAHPNCRCLFVAAGSMRDANSTDPPFVELLTDFDPDEPRDESGKWTEAGTVAYHGSSHDFDKFDAAFIGSGQGAQTYGRGLYFAEAPEVASSYKREGSSPFTGFVRHGQPVPTPTATEQQDYMQIAPSGETLDKAITNLGATIDQTKWALGKGSTASLSAQQQGATKLERLQSTLALAKQYQSEGYELGNPPEGNTYTVRIHAKPEDMLDWDAPLSRQPKVVQDFVNSHIDPQRLRGNTFSGGQLREPTGEDILHRISGGVVGANMMAAAGIKGIRYLDEKSRQRGSIEREMGRAEEERRHVIANQSDISDPQAGSGGYWDQRRKDIEEKIAGLRKQRNALPSTHNMVIFNPDNVEITHKNGKSVGAMHDAEPDDDAAFRREWLRLSLMALPHRDMVADFSADEPRDPQGKWTASEVHGLTKLDLMEGAPKFAEGDRVVTEVADELVARSQKALRGLGVKGGKITESTSEHDALLSRAIAEETKHALKQSGNAADWYTGQVETAMRLAAVRHPEIESDANKRAAFKAALAITSQGEAVDRNVTLADDAYSEFAKTGSFPESAVASKQGPAMQANFKKFNGLVKALGADGATEFLARKMTVGQLKKAGYAVSSLPMDAEVNGSAMFGPKIGAGFYQNLSGNYDPVTQDLWFMRTWGRLTGTMRDTVKTEAGREKAYDRLKAALKEAGTPVPKTTEGLNAKARELFGEHESNYKKFRKEYDSGARTKDEAAHAAERVVNILEGIKEDPGSGSERAWRAKVVNQARGLLEKQGTKISNADLQATIWYPEKTLWKRLGSKGGLGGNTDYAKSYERLLHEKGVDDAKIQSAIRRSRSA